MTTQIPTPTELLGNASLELKQRTITICTPWLWTPNDVFCNNINRTTKLKGVWFDVDERVGGPEPSSSSSSNEASKARKLRILTEIDVMEGTLGFHYRNLV